MAKDDWAAVVGVILGALGAVAIAKILSQKKCPHCNHLNPNTNDFCKWCRGQLR